MNKGNEKNCRQCNEARPLLSAVLHYWRQHPCFAIESKQLEKANDSKKRTDGKHRANDWINRHDLLEVNKFSCGEM